MELQRYLEGLRGFEEDFKRESSRGSLKDNLKNKEELKREL